MTRSTVADEPGHHRNRDQFHVSEPQAQSGVELGHHLLAHYRAWDLAVLQPGDRRLVPQGRGLGCR